MEMDQSALDQAIHQANGLVLAGAPVQSSLPQIQPQESAPLNQEQQHNFLANISPNAPGVQQPSAFDLWLRPRMENFAQGLSLGNYQPPQQDQQGIGGFERAMEQGIGGLIPFTAATLLTGGAADAMLAPEAVAAMGGRTALSTLGGGLLTGAAAPAKDGGDRLKNALVGGAEGYGFGMLGKISNPLIQAALSTASMGTLAALQGGGRDQILANMVLGAGTPLFFKGVEAIGGGETGGKLMTDLYQKFGSDSYRFLANKDLIQKVVTGQGSPEDIAQFNILNNLGLTAEAARSDKGLSIESTDQTIPKTGPVWKFLETMFPNSFKDGAPTSEFINPETTPLQSVPEMQLDQHENDALMRIDEKNPNPENPAPLETSQAIEQKLAEQKGQVPESGQGADALLNQANPTIDPSIANPATGGEEAVIEALMSGDKEGADRLHNDMSAEMPMRPMEELQALADQRSEDQSQQIEEAKSGVASESIMKDPSISQYTTTLRKASRIYNLRKGKGSEDIATITKRVPGLDVALEALREKGQDVSNMDHLAQLTKLLPKKSDKVAMKAAPQTAAERVAANILPQEAAPTEAPIPVGTPPEEAPIPVQAAQPNVPLSNVITDPNDPNYDFAADMDSRVAMSPSAMSNEFESPETQQQAINDAVGKGEAATGGIPPVTPGEEPTSFTNQPKGGYVKELQPIIARLAQGSLDNYPTGRDFTKVIVGRRSTNNHVAEILQNWAQKLVPDQAQREQAFLAADESIPETNLTPQQRVLLEQVRGINELIGLRKQELYPGARMIDKYMTRIPLTDTADQIVSPGKALSQTSRADFHRSIWRFVPTDGSGPGKIMSTLANKFPLSKVPEDPTLWQDGMGKTYSMEHATVNDIEKAFPGLKYEKDIANVGAQNVNDFLDQKDHHFAVKAIEDGMMRGESIPPGQPAPADYRAVDVKGLEGYRHSPAMASALENLAHDPNISKWEQGYKNAEDAVTSIFFYNALKHPLNMLNLGLGFSGQYRSGIPLIDAVLPGPQGMAKFIGTMPRANAVIGSRGDVFWALKDAGSNVDTFGKTATERFINKASTEPGVVKGLKAVGKYNPGALFYKANRNIVGHVDDILRTDQSLLHYQTITGRELTPDGVHLEDQFDPKALQQAVAAADKEMVDYGNLSRGEKRASRLAFMFYPWLKGLMGDAMNMARHPIAYRGSIQNFLLMGVAGVAATKLYQQLTGNDKASVDQYGLNQFGNQLMKAPGDLASHRVPTVITSHVLRPILKEAIQQATNKDLFTGKDIYDSNRVQTLQDQNNPLPQTEGSIRLQHAAGNLIAPLQPMLKVARGNQTPTEAFASSYLGLKTPHTAGHAAAPALMGKNTPLASLNAKGTADNPTQPTTGIASLNFRDTVNKQLDPATRNKMQTVSNLLSEAYSQGNPAKKIEAYQLLATDPQLLRYKSIMEVGTATAEKRPVNPLWSLGITDPAAQQTVMYYNALVPGPDKQAFNKDPQNKAILDGYHAAEGDYYSQLAASGNANAKAGGIQAPAPSKAVSEALDQAKATKNYSLYDRPDVKAYFNQLDFYDSYVRDQFGLSGTGYSSGKSGGGYGGYGSSSAMTSERYLAKQLMYQNLNNSTQGQQLKLGIPKGATTQVGDLAKLRSMKRIAPPSVAIKPGSSGSNQPQVGSGGGKVPFFQGSPIHTNIKTIM